MRARADELVSFTDTISTHRLTLDSTPVLLSRKQPDDQRLFNTEKSIITAFKESGFHTTYISYLHKNHPGDSGINQIVSEADVYVNARQNVSGRYYDEHALPSVAEALNSGEQKSFLIFKMIGSHFNFEDRYPARFDVFQPSLFGERVSGYTPRAQTTTRQFL